MMLASPDWMACDASATARRPEPQTWLTPQAGVPSGTPAAMARLPRRVLAMAGGQHLAEDDFIDIIGRHPGIGQRGGDARCGPVHAPTPRRKPP